jgi:hypothetical protein
MFLLALFSTFAHAATQPEPPSTTSRQPVVRIDDVARFYAVYDKADGKPSAAALQAGYLDTGSPGLRQFVTARISSAEKLADAIAKSPQDFRNARHCVPMLPAARDQLRRVFSALTTLDPQATLPPVTIVIGRNNTGGTTTASGVTIGLEVICRSNWLAPDITQRLVHLIAHEYVHVQQPAAQVAPPANATVLFASLVEGGAEFIGELIRRSPEHPPETLDAGQGVPHRTRFPGARHGYRHVRLAVQRPRHTRGAGRPRKLGGLPHRARLLHARQ